MNKSRYIVWLVIVVVVGLVIYFSVPNKSGDNSGAGIVYKNTDYGFSFNLPDSWKGYSIVSSTWSGDSINSSGQLKMNTVYGPMISIRHPLWTTANPRQDIPVMVFTLQQWSDLQADKFHIGAAPINPSELGRNSKYVFGLPARYNFAYPTGFEEVDQLIHSGNFRVF